MKLDELDKISAAQIGMFIMRALFNDELQDKITEITTPLMEGDVLATKRRDLAAVNDTDDPADLVNLVRKTKDMEAKRILIKKILANQGETMPLLMKRFHTSVQEIFIETATIVFGYCEEKYVDTMLLEYDQIRSVYAQSEFCMMLGFRNRKDCIPFLKKEYDRMKAMKSERSIAQGPLSALHELV